MANGTISRGDDDGGGGGGGDSGGGGGGGGDGGGGGEWQIGRQYPFWARAVSSAGCVWSGLFVRDTVLPAAQIVPYYAAN